jgi:hypothetical protein
MTTTTLEAPQEPEVDAGELVTRVEDLSDEVRREIVAQREAGTTLAELKANFPQVEPAVIREVLPPANARERKAREAKAPKVDQPKDEAPKPAPEPRYATDPGDLAQSVVDARQLIGRGKLAKLLHVSGSAVWRFEHGRIHPDELDGLISGMSQVDQLIEQGEFTKPEKVPKTTSPSKAELTHRIEVAVAFIAQVRGDRGVSKSALADGVLVLLDPPADVAPQA